MIGRLRRLTRRSPHVDAETVSRYLDDELGESERLGLDEHASGCGECSELVRSMRSTLRALRSMPSSTRSGLGDSVIAVLREGGPESAFAPRARASRAPSGVLSVVPDIASDAVTEAGARGDAHAPLLLMPRALLRYCLRRPQLRLTLPLGLLVGVALSLINKGYMIFEGRVDAEMCAVCALNFVIPFVALNIGLLVATRVTGRKRV